MSERAHVRATPEQVRAIIHPLRLRIMDALRDEGPSTATRLAALLGESSGATSYHLRVLAEAGVIEEDPERGNARDRWWRRAQLLYIPTDSDDPAGRAVELSARHLHLSRDEEALRQFIAGMDTLSNEWRGAAFTGNFTFHLTAQEVFDLGLEFLGRLEELRRPPEEWPDDVRRVSITFRAVPWIDDPPGPSKTDPVSGRALSAPPTTLPARGRPRSAEPKRETAPPRSPGSGEIGD